LNHLSIAKGSLAELETLLILSRDIEMLSNEKLEQCLMIADEVGRMLTALRASLARRL
jgi:four helix bundle protein